MAARRVQTKAQVEAELKALKEKVVEEAYKYCENRGSSRACIEEFLRDVGLALRTPPVNVFIDSDDGGGLDLDEDKERAVRRAVTQALEAEGLEIDSIDFN